MKDSTIELRIRKDENEWHKKEIKKWYQLLCHKKK